jgi:hypothetical protein
MGRHFVVFDDGRNSSETHPLVDFLQIIPARKIKVLAGMLHVILYEPGKRGHEAVPRPSGFLRVAVDASVRKHGGYRRGNVRARQQWPGGSIRYVMLD